MVTGDRADGELAVLLEKRAEAADVIAEPRREDPRAVGGAKLGGGGSRTAV
jgi:chorismate mutase